MTEVDRATVAPGDRWQWAAQWRRRWMTSSEALTVADRRRIADQLLVGERSDHLVTFWLMLVLSVIIATFGMLRDNTAVVIGAMLLSPLMTPVIGFALGLTLRDRGALKRSSWLLLSGSVVAAAVAWLLTVVEPAATLVLPTEVTLRTQPVTTDLGIALAAGVAGGVATVRADIPTALPGVAIAVAMVPPIAAVGITLGAGEPDLAFDALLLYVANVVAIALGSGVVLLVTGFVPRYRFRRSLRPILGGLGVLALVALLIAVPLRLGVVRAVADARTSLAVDGAVQDWLGDGTDVEVVAVHTDRNRVVVEVAGPVPPPPVAELTERLRDDVADDTEVVVRWSEQEVERARA